MVILDFLNVVCMNSKHIHTIGTDSNLHLYGNEAAVTASIGPKFCISYVIIAAGVVPCGDPIKSPRADYIFVRSHIGFL